MITDTCLAERLRVSSYRWRATESARDPVERRIELHNHFASQILEVKDHPSVLLVRYEDWFLEERQLERITEFLSIPSVGHLRPRPILPDPVALSDEEQERVLRGCVVAEQFDYDLREPGCLQSGVPGVVEA